MPKAFSIALHSGSGRSTTWSKRNIFQAASWKRVFFYAVPEKHFLLSGEGGQVLCMDGWKEAKEWLDGVVFDDPAVSDRVEKILHPDHFKTTGRPSVLKRLEEKKQTIHRAEKTNTPSKKMTKSDNSLWKHAAKSRIYITGIMTTPKFYGMFDEVRKSGQRMSGKEKRCSQLSIGYILRAKVI